jgi:tetratricopeptide (TPR) repeat protein
MSKRLEVLQKMIASGTGDASFARYALAMELKSLERYDDALKAFEELRAFDASYVAQYLMAGGVAEKLGKVDEARAWYEQGVAAARKKGDHHAMSEIQGALATLG